MAATEAAAGEARRTLQRERQAAGHAPVTGLSVVRDELERQPRDPFAVDSQNAVEALHAEWGHAYQLAWHEGLYCAQRTGPGGKPCGPVLTGRTPDEIEQALRRDWGEA